VRQDLERILRAWESGDLGASVLGGETPGQAWERAVKDVAPLSERHAHDDIVIVGHGRLNKILTSGLVHGHLHHMEHYPQANAGITLVDGPRPWRVVSGNTTRHLGGVRALDERHS
jgi:broad specificity phosphatase PhoE